MVVPKTKNKSIRRTYRAGRVVNTRRKTKINRLKNTARLAKKRPTTIYGFRKELALRKNNTSLNIESFALLEGVYSSYWVGKLINSLFYKGNKKTAAKHVYRAFAVVKYAQLVNPLVALLEILDKVKPTFRLRNYVMRRVIIKEFPSVEHHRYHVLTALRWLKSEIQAGSGQFGSSLANEIAKKLLDFRTSLRKNSLVRKRSEHIRRVIKAQFNVRYN
jgi:ribosomal protein S7